MNEIDFRILGLHTKIERNKKLSKQLKVLAGVCLYFSIWLLSWYKEYREYRQKSGFTNEHSMDYFNYCFSRNLY